jgi:hypothetical protein
MEQQRLNKLVYINYNKRLHDRFEMRRVLNNSDNFDPILVEELNYSSEWMTGIEGAANEFVYEEDGLTWAQVVSTWSLFQFVITNLIQKMLSFLYSNYFEILLLYYHCRLMKY